MPVSRRKFLKLSALSLAAAALAACGSNPSAQLFANAGAALGQASHPDELFIPRALRRILLAPTSADLAHARQIGLDAFIDEQLAPNTISDPLVGPRLAGFETLGMDPVQLAQTTPRQKPGQQLSQAALVRAVYSQRQLYELMVDFWSNHFNIYLGKNTDRYLKTIDDREVIRPNALGKFPDLLMASAKSPAMLIYLDNALSKSKAPNENYARELMELHTLSVDGGYTQADVHEVARALTGWTVSGLRAQNPGTFLFNSQIHDDGAKLILGHSFPAGKGIQDGEQLMTMLAESPSTARFICTKLVRRFVADDPPAALVASASSAFTLTRGDITSVMSVILHSSEFKASLGSKIKRPFEFIASALRASGADFNPGPPTLDILRHMGQPLFGWESPNGFPDAAPAWITTNGVLSRWNYPLALAFNALSDTHLDPSQLVQASASTGGGLDALCLRLLGEPLPASQRQVILDFAGNASFETIAPALLALVLSAPIFFYR